jgi:ATP-dependent helicase HrpB
MEPLPIDQYLPEIAASLQSTNALILSAPPGSGKTTRIPRMLFDTGFAEKGEILILEPRRLAARMAASRVAQEFGEKPGETVGYSIRFEHISGPKTRIRFLTEAILTRRIIGDPNLRGISVVILDEFHERHLATDLALAFLKQLQHSNPTLKLLVMSATLDVNPLAAYLPNAHQISIEASRHPLTIHYEEKPDARPVHEKAVSAVLRLVRSGIQGDILVFLPGATEIRRSEEVLRTYQDSLGFMTALLHGDLPAIEQRRALEPSNRIKAILSTNVAETSITIPGIAAVVDCGLANIAGHSVWSGFPTLNTSKISQSSATQRAGRAGRTQAGEVLRLYTQADFHARPIQETPEIRRTDLTETALMLHGAGIRNIKSFDWFESPSEPALEAAETLLLKLGAIDIGESLTPMGARMLQIPVHPRIARLILEGEQLQVGEECALLAALISERDIRRDQRANIGRPKTKASHLSSGSSDLLELLERFQEAESARFQSEPIHALGLDLQAVHSVRQVYRQLRRLLQPTTMTTSAKLPESRKEEALLMAILTAFPDRVARRRSVGSSELILSGGGSAFLSPTSVVHQSMFMTVVGVAERKEAHSLKQSAPFVRLASAIEIEWLAILFPDELLQKTELMWNEHAERVEEVRKTLYGQITLEEITRTALPSAKASQILANAVLSRGMSLSRDDTHLVVFLNKLELLSQYFPSEKWPQIETEDINVIILQLCDGKRSFEELGTVSLADGLLETLGNRQRALLSKETPDRISLKTGRSVRIHYESGKPPWIESRLQDFFGTYETPKICAGRVSLTIHLLAPNQRAVQVTQDLAGFWERHYSGIRRELMRRYPKHAWPEKVEKK